MIILPSKGDKAKYLLVYYLDGAGSGYEKYSLTLDTATFQPWSELLSVVSAAAITSISESVATAVQKLEAR